jgi:hypothetical protein
MDSVSISGDVVWWGNDSSDQNELFEIRDSNNNCALHETLEKLRGKKVKVTIEVVE